MRPSTPPLSGVQDGPLLLPAATTTVLENGLTVLAVPYSRLPVVSLRLVSRAGRWTEAREERGLSGMSAMLARHGTQAWDSAELARLQDARGLRVGASGSLDDRVVAVRALSEELPLAVQALTQLARHATFPQDHLDREVDTAVQSLRHRRASPDTVCAEALSARLHPDHPYGHPPASEAELRGITAERLRDWQGRRVGPESALLVAVGDLDAERLVELAREQLADWEPATLPAAPTPVAPDADRSVLLFDRPASEQATVSLGFTAPVRTDPSWARLRLLCAVLGGGASSRLFLELREKRGLTYGASAGLDAGRYGGDIVVSLACSTERVGEALEATVAELERLRNEPVLERELETARRGLLGGLPMAASSQGGLASLFGTRWLFGLPVDVWARLGDELAAVGPDELIEAARRWLDPATAHAVVVGRAGPLLSACSVLGEVRVEPLPGA